VPIHFRIVDEGHLAGSDFFHGTMALRINPCSETTGDFRVALYPDVVEAIIEQHVVDDDWFCPRCVASITGTRIIDQDEVWFGFRFTGQEGQRRCEE